MFITTLVNAFRLVYWAFGTEVLSFTTFVKVRDNFKNNLFLLFYKILDIFFRTYD